MTDMDDRHRHDDRETVEIAGVALSHPAKVLFPENGLTKLDLARYYVAVAERMLPHVQGRPLTLLRCPAGRGKPCFYQRHDEHAPAQLKRIDIPENDGVATYLIVDDLPGLIALVQRDVLELHLWGSTRENLERPDRIVMDLDPDEGLPWERVTQAALTIRDRLAKIGLRSFVKGTGGKGLHVVVPFTPRHGWEEVTAFSKGIADTLAAEAPDSFTTTLSKARRKGKIFVDYLRNQRGATAVAPYSVRARPGAPVAAPLTWEEVEGGMRGDRFTVATLAQRLAMTPRDPWEDLPKLRQDLPAAGFG